MVFYGICDEVSAPRLAQEMLVIAKSIEIHRDEIISAYSAKDSITYDTTIVNYFEGDVPENGSVQELFKDDINAKNDN